MLGEMMVIRSTAAHLKGTSAVCTYNSRRRNDCIERMTNLIYIYTKVLKTKSYCLICGDVNIDRHPPNNPDQRHDIKDLIPILDNFLADNRVAVLNSDVTRHKAGKRSTLLDLFMSNVPEKCSNWKNIPNLM